MSGAGRPMRAGIERRTTKRLWPRRAAITRVIARDSNRVTISPRAGAEETSDGCAAPGGL